MEPNGVRVATFNVHYLSQRVPAMNWDGRQEAVMRVIEAMNADIIAFQEMETFAGGRFSDTNLQLDSVLAAFPEYAAAAVGDPEVYPSTQPILYRPADLRVVTQGFFFFSETPDTIYSRPWHKRFPAFASWASFERLADGFEFTVFNVHTDASSGRNRMKTARLVVDRIENRDDRGAPVILAGDFNAPASFPSARIYDRADLVRARGSSATFHFNRGLHLFPAIDHIRVSGGLSVSQASVVRLSLDGIWPSDHYPVLAVATPTDQSTN